MAAGPLSAHPRADAMAARLARDTAAAGVSAGDVARIVTAFHEALAARAGFVNDPGHFAWLHPARTALILLDDARVRSPSLLVAACAFDATWPDVRAAGEAAAARGEAEAAALLREAVAVVTGYDSPGADLLERLLASSADARLLILADRLDRVRHLHLEAARGEWAAVHGETAAVHLPAAARTNRVLERRFGWWTRTFARRFL